MTLIAPSESGNPRIEGEPRHLARIVRESGTFEPESSEPVQPPSEVPTYPVPVGTVDFGGPLP